MQISATIEFGDRLGERSLREMLEGKARRTPAAQQGCRCDEVRIDARQGSAAGVEEPSLLQFGNHEIANGRADRGRKDKVDIRSEEHTSELQSLMLISYPVFCLQIKKNRIQNF